MNRGVACRILGCVCLATALLLYVAPASAGTCVGMSGGPCDLDGDSYERACLAVGGDDCDDTDPRVWARTQAVGQVKLAKAGTVSVISWNPILDTGGAGNPFTYEIVRSRVPSNFATHPTATCLNPGGTELQFNEAATPPPGGVFFYIVRGRNTCGPGNPGTRSNGTPRDAKDCAFSVVCNDTNACTDDSALNGACTHTPIPPKIIHGPSSIGVCNGDIARFWVETDNETTAHYAWTKNGIPVGGDSPVLVLPPATAADNHSAIEVTVSVCGEASPTISSLTVFTDPNACEGGLNGPPAPNGAGDSMRQKYWNQANFKGPKGMDGSRVNLHSGELEVAATDIEIRGRGFDFAFTRYYRSRVWQSTSMGVGWTHSYDRHATSHVSGGVVVFNPMSGSELFAAPPPGGSCYVSPAGVFEELCQQPDGTLRITYPDGHTWIFHELDSSSTSGKILESRDKFDNVMSFTYDTVGKLTTITDTLGRPITLTYNTRNLIDSVTDFTGSSVHYVYFAGGQPGGEIDDLKSVTSPLIVGTPTGNDFPQGRTTSYTYSNGFALGEENHNLMSITGPDGKTFARFSYRLTDNQNDPAFDRVGTAIRLDGTRSEDDGLIESFTYVALTPTPANDFAVSKTIVKDATNHRSDYFYNTQAQLVRVVDSTGVLPEAAYFASDTDNVPGPPDNPADPPQLVTKLQFNSNSLLTELTMPSLSSVSRVYDSGNPSVLKRGDLLSETWHPGPLGGDQSQITRSWTYATPYGTDWAGRSETRIVHPPGTPPGTWRRISDVRIVHPPGTPPGTWRALNPKLNQEMVDPFASTGAGAERRIRGGAFDNIAARRISDVRIVHPPGTPPGTWRSSGGGYDLPVWPPMTSVEAFRRISDVRIVHPPGTPPGTQRDYAPYLETCDDDPGLASDAVSATTMRFEKCVSTHSGDFKYRTGIIRNDPYDFDADGDGYSDGGERHGRCDHADLQITKYQDSCSARIVGGNRGRGVDRHLELDAFGGTLPSSGFPTTETDESGRVWTFTYDTTGFLTDLQLPTVLTGTLTGAPQTIHYHWDRNAYGQIVSYTDPANQVSTLDWSSSGPDNGYLRELHIPAGTLTAGYQYTFSLRGQLTSFTDPLGHTTTFTLNDDDEVVRVTGPAPLSYQTDFIYDIDGRIVRIDRQNVDENGAVKPNAYVSSKFVLDLAGELKGFYQEIDGPQCAIEEYEHDEAYRPTKIKTGAPTPGGSAKLVRELEYARVKVKFPWISVSKDELGNAWARQTFDFDADGRVTAMHDGLPPAASIAHTSFAYDGYGRPVSVTDAEGNVASVHYDAVSNIVSSQLEGELADGSSGPNVLLRTGLKEYNEIRQYIAGDTVIYNRATGAPIGDGHDMCLAYYDEQGNLWRTQDDNGHGLTFTYEPGRRLIQIQDDITNVETIECNLDGSIESITQTSAGSPGSPPLSTTTHFEYDAIGRTTAVVDPAGNRSEATYDRAGLRLRSWEALSDARYVRDGLGRLLEAQYDMTDTGDLTGNVVATYVTSQTWDDRGNVTSTTDAEGNTWTYGYDGGDRLNLKTAPDGTHTSLVWSPRSNLVSATDANGSVATFTNDKLGRVTGVSIVRAPGVGGTTAEQFVYDGAGALVSASDDDSIVTRQYDSRGLMLSETQQIVGVPPRTMTITRDDTGTATGIVYPSGHQVSYGVDALDRTQVVFADGAFVALYDYLGTDRLSRVIHGNMAGTSYTYDTSGRTEQKVVLSSSGDGAYVSQVSWDQVRLASRTEPVFGTTTAYTYDSLDRLETSHTTSPVIDDERIYTLSATGDRVILIGGLDAGTYTRNPVLPEPGDFQMHQYTETPSGTRNYDKNGNTLTMHGGTTAELTMSHDVNGFIVFAGGVSYGQDALGRYMLKAGIPLRSWTHGPGGVIEQYDGPTLEARFVRGAGGELLQMIEDVDINGNGTLDTYTYHTDDEGNVRALTDQTGVAVELYNYDDYGSPSFYMNPSAPLPFSLTGNPFLYRSMLWDPVTKLYETGGAAYDSRTARGTSRPLVAHGGHGRVKWSGSGWESITTPNLSINTRYTAPSGGFLSSTDGIPASMELLPHTGIVIFGPLPDASSTPQTMHWVLEVRVDRIEMK